MPYFFAAAVRHLTRAADMQMRHSRILLAAAFGFFALSIVGYAVGHPMRLAFALSGLPLLFFAWQTRALAQTNQAHAADLNLRLSQFASSDIVQHDLR